MREEETRSRGDGGLREGAEGAEGAEGWTERRTPRSQRPRGVKKYHLGRKREKRVSTQEQQGLTSGGLRDCKNNGAPALPPPPPPTLQARASQSTWCSSTGCSRAPCQGSEVQCDRGCVSVQDSTGFFLQIHLLVSSRRVIFSEKTAFAN